jgi:hypothetical protein
MTWTQVELGALPGVYEFEKLLEKGTQIVKLG